MILRQILPNGTLEEWHGQGISNLWCNGRKTKQHNVRSRIRDWTLESGADKV